jgi:hypothetical protein
VARALSRLGLDEQSFAVNTLHRMQSGYILGVPPAIGIFLTPPDTIRDPLNLFGKAGPIIPAGASCRDQC